MKPWEVPSFKANDSLYRAGFDKLLKETADREIQQIASAFPSDMEQHERQDIRAYVEELKVELHELIDKTAKDTRKKFLKEYAAVRAEKAKADQKAQREKAEQNSEEKAATDKKKVKKESEVQPEKELKANKKKTE